MKRQRCEAWREHCHEELWCVLIEHHAGHHASFTEHGDLIRWEDDRVGA